MLGFLSKRLIVDESPVNTEKLVCFSVSILFLIEWFCDQMNERICANSNLILSVLETVRQKSFQINSIALLNRIQIEYK